MALELSDARLSYDDYAALPDHGQRYQVIDGALVLSPTPQRRHQWISIQLAMIVNAHVRANELGEAFAAPYDVVLVAERPAVIVQPDFLFISRERLDRSTAVNVQGAPDLVVEVLSPSNARLDRTRKAALYAEHGVREYWIIPHDVDRVEVYAPGPDGAFGKPVIYHPGEVVETPLLPGLRLDVAALFPPEEPV